MQEAAPQPLRRFFDYVPAGEAITKWERSLARGYYSREGAHRPLMHHTQRLAKSFADGAPVSSTNDHLGCSWPRGPDGGAWGAEGPIPSPRDLAPLIPSPTNSLSPQRRRRQPSSLPVDAPRNNASWPSSPSSRSRGHYDAKNPPGSEAPGVHIYANAASEQLDASVGVQAASEAEVLEAALAESGVEPAVAAAVMALATQGRPSAGVAAASEHADSGRKQRKGRASTTAEDLQSESEPPLAPPPPQPTTFVRAPPGFDLRTLTKQVEAWEAEALASARREAELRKGCEALWRRLERSGERGWAVSAEKARQLEALEAAVAALRRRRAEYGAVLARVRGWTDTIQGLRAERASHLRAEADAGNAFVLLRRQLEQEAEKLSLSRVAADAANERATALESDDVEALLLLRADQAEELRAAVLRLALARAWSALRTACWRSRGMRRLESRRLVAAGAAVRPVLRWWCRMAFVRRSALKAHHQRLDAESRVSLMKWRIFVALEQRFRLANRRRLLRNAFGRLNAYRLLELRRWRLKELKAAVTDRKLTAGAFAAWLEYHRRFRLAPRDERRLTAKADHCFARQIFCRWHTTAVCASARRRELAALQAARSRLALVRRAWLGWKSVGKAAKFRRKRLQSWGLRRLRNATAARRRHGIKAPFAGSGIGWEEPGSAASWQLDDVEGLDGNGRVGACRRRRQLLNGFAAFRAATNAASERRHLDSLARRWAFGAWAALTERRRTQTRVVAAVHRKQLRQSAISLLQSWRSTTAAAVQRKREAHRQVTSAALKAWAEVARRGGRERLVQLFVLQPLLKVFRRRRLTQALGAWHRHSAASVALERTAARVRARVQRRLLSDALTSWMLARARTQRALVKGEDAAAAAAGISMLRRNDVAAADRRAVAELSRDCETLEEAVRAAREAAQAETARAAAMTSKEQRDSATAEAAAADANLRSGQARLVASQRRRHAAAAEVSGREAARGSRDQQRHLRKAMQEATRRKAEAKKALEHGLEKLRAAAEALEDRKARDDAELAVALEVATTCEALQKTKEEAVQALQHEIQEASAAVEEAGRQLRNAEHRSHQEAAALRARLVPLKSEAEVQGFAAAAAEARAAEAEQMLAEAGEELQGLQRAAQLADTSMSAVAFGDGAAECRGE